MALMNHKINKRSTQTRPVHIYFITLLPEHKTQNLAHLPKQLHKLS